MKRAALCRILVAFVAIPALADISGTAVLASNANLNLDTGQKGTGFAGGDVVYLLGSLYQVGKATTFVYPGSGQSTFDSLTQNQILGFKSQAGVAFIQPNVGTIILVFTNGGSAAKLLVTGLSGGLNVSFVTYTPTNPTITGVLNNSSHIAPGLPNYGIAPSSIFIITGASLADPGNPVLQSSAAPGLPLTLNGASISVTVGGVTTHPAIYYTSPNQIAAVLPAATRLGRGTITVSYKGVTSAAFPIEVVASAVGINTYSGFGVATDAITGSLITYNNSASPGEILVLWTTGLGADPLDSDTTFSSSPHSVSAPLHLYVGGVEATILYQGSAGYPGVNQINFTVPASAPTGCYVSLVAVVGTLLNHSVILPINPGGGPCVDVVNGLTGDQISLPSGASFRLGVVTLSSSNEVGRITNSASAAFISYRGTYPTGNQVSPGGCIIYDFTPQPTPDIVALLDSGTVSLTGPNNLSLLLALVAGGGRNTALPNTAIPQTGGSFTFKGSGGNGNNSVGSFSVDITLSNPVLNWTNPSTVVTVPKSKDLLITWTGGNPGTYVYITGGTSLIQGTTLTQTAYKCVAPADAHQFTVPPYILSAIPDGNGTTGIQNVFLTPFAVSGVDVAVAGASIFQSVSSRYQ